jgi:hypothetical protein
MGTLMRLCLDTNILIDVLKGEPSALAWLEHQQRPAVSLITWMEVLVGCQPDEAPVVKSWLEGFDRIAVDPCVAEAAVLLRQEHALKLPDAIILASAQCSGFVLATRNTKDFPLRLRGVLHPYEL